jgi:hypothetical protein
VTGSGTIRRMGRAYLRRLLATCAVTTAVACGLAEVGTGPAPDAGAGDAGAREASTLDSGSDAITDAGAARFACPTSDAAVSDCASCPNRPVACADCPFSGGGAPVFFCTAHNAACVSTAPKGYGYCKCPSGDAQACALPLAQCNPYNGGVCVTCGENLTNGYACKQGGTCNQSQNTCN